MRILIISHNVFSDSENMGKTLLNLFSGFDEDDICQLYFHSEVPTVDGICGNYFRITDRDALKSIVTRTMHGTKFDKSQVQKDLNTSRIDTGAVAKIYQKGRKRTPLIYLARDFIWSLSNWFSEDLKLWLLENKPDVLFYAAGDYSFSYKIAYKIAKYLKIPLIVYCVDDFFLFNANWKRLLGKVRQRLFMKTVYKTIGLADSIITICDKMASDYSKLFNKKCHVIYTTSENKTINFSLKPQKFAYFGSLGVNRDMQLIDIGQAVINTADSTGIHTVDVYTAEKRSEVLKRMSHAPGITLHNAVSQNEMLKILAECIAVIHTESFDDIFRQRVKYSISTKIAESLMYGPCLFVYGPEEVGSVEYVRENQAAYVVSKKEELENGLIELFTNTELRDTIIKSARTVANKNHNSTRNHLKIKEWLNDAIIINKGS